MSDTGHDVADLTGADYFALHAGVALDDARDPVEGFNAIMLAELVTAAETFAAELRTLVERGSAEPIRLDVAEHPTTDNRTDQHGDES